MVRPLLTSVFFACCAGFAVGAEPSAEYGPADQGCVPKLDAKLKQILEQLAGRGRI